MKKLKKFLSFVICIVFSISIACGVVGCGNDADANKVSFNFAINSGGMGRAWADSAVARFEELVAEKEYEPGKKGVKINIDQHTIHMEDAKTSAYDVYACDHYSMSYSVANAIKNGTFACIDDIVTVKDETINGATVSIEDKIPENNRATLKNAEGKYYLVPFYNFYPGLSYDVQLFDRMGFYFSNDDSGNLFHSEILNKDFYFVEGDENGVIDNKSYGPDGEDGGGDDGLPATLEELVALCEYMKDGDVEVYPFLVTGQYPYYSNFLLEALTTALQGYDKANAMYSLNGTIEVVTGFSDAPLFPGVETIKKPITKTVNMTEANGYYASQSVEKYYAQAFMQLAYEKDWFHNDSLIGTVSQRNVMQSFIFNGVDAARVQVGMLIEASFWYVEAEIGAYPQRYDSPSGPNHDGHAPRKIEFMPLPINFDSTGLNQNQTFAEYSMTFLGINARTESDPIKMEVCKDFIKFMCSNEENINFNTETGLKKPFNYELPASTTLRYHYYTKLEELLSKSDLVSYYAENEVFNSYPNIFQKGYFDESYGAGGKTNYLEYLKEINGANAKDAFLEKTIKKQDWSTYYNGVVAD